MWNIKVLTRTPETRGKSEHNGTEHLHAHFLEVHHQMVFVDFFQNQDLCRGCDSNDDAL